MKFYLHIYVTTEKVLTPNTLFSHLLKKRKKILDSRGYTGAVLMYLSKAFDTINQEPSIVKLYASTFSKGCLETDFQLYV